MRSLKSSTWILGLFVLTTGSIAMGCGDGTSSSTSSGAGGNAGSSTGGAGGIGGAGGQATSSGGAGGAAGQGGGGSGQGGSAGSGGGQGGGGQGGGSGACMPGETQACYTGTPTTVGVGACKGGTYACVNGQWDTSTCMGEVLPSGETCDDVDNNCDGQVDNDLGTTTCGMGVCQVTVGNCAGGKPQTCTPGQPSASKCDGLDDNCNGQIDEPEEGCSCTDGKTQPCYSGAMGTAGVGVCKQGVQTCAGGAWGACMGEILPSAESCNLLDDDCNGVKDDGLGQTTCGTGVCAKTVNNCVNGAFVPCTPGLATAESCNNLDDNCNGVVDDGLGSISCGVGACRRVVQTCTAGMQGTCVPGMPTMETCDDIDNNCNGVVDEGNPGGGGPCTTPLPGICATGVQQCSNGNFVCQVTVQPTMETCNGLDDNCNGVVDDGNPGGGGTCPTGVPGICANGTSTCNNGSIICLQTVFPSVENCDGIDNNCNGVIDENNAGGGAVCTVMGQQGLCAQGAQTCTGGTLVCTQTVQPTMETCDAKDNDCDGVVDDGNPGGNTSCTASGQTGECANGTTNCTGGNVACTPKAPTGEVCDGKDNDCNGTVDNGNPGGGAACMTALPGICRNGTTTCSNGALVCNSNQMPTAELCNNLDDNCNGQVDENNPGSAQACTASGQVGQCALGTTTCSNGSITCVPGPSTAETCDGKDNNCNGMTDEGNPGGGVLCTPPGVFGECAKGTTSCAGGTLTCVPAAAGTEICDGKDNDCDGLVDENNPGGGGTCATGNLGICSTGTVTCVNSALACIQNQMPAAIDACSNGLDDNCNGTTDESLDLDGDGWGTCTGDCCDSSAQCSNPALVNPGAFEVVGNGLNDDCDATTSDTVAAAACSTVALQTPTTALKLVQAMDLCQFTTASPPLPQKKWGVISQTLTAANGGTPAPQDLQLGVLANFGPNVIPRKGTTMAALSSGTARDSGDVGFIQPETGWIASATTGTAPAVYLAAHGGTLQSTAGCVTGNAVNDSANLQVQIRVPTNALSFTYKFKFYSTEFPEWICTQYNDFYLALLTQSNVAGIPADRNISFDTNGNPVSVNNGFFDVCQYQSAYPQFLCPDGTTELIGTGVGGAGTTLNDGGGTKWLTTTSPIVPGETMTIQFMIWDTGDHEWDSTVLLDAFEWSTNAGTVGTSPSLTAGDEQGAVSLPSH